MLQGENVYIVDENGVDDGWDLRGLGEKKRVSLRERKTRGVEESRESHVLQYNVHIYTYIYLQTHTHIHLHINIYTYIHNNTWNEPTHKHIHIQRIYSQHSVFPLGYI